MRKAALSRRNVLKAGWPVDIPGLSGMPEVAAGLHVKVDVDNFAREQELVAKAEAVGVEVTPLSNFWLADSEVPVDKRAGLVLGFAAVPEGEIAEALMRLRKACSAPGAGSQATTSRPWARARATQPLPITPLPSAAKVLISVMKVMLGS